MYDLWHGHIMFHFFRLFSNDNFSYKYIRSSESTILISWVKNENLRLKLHTSPYLKVKSTVRMQNILFVYVLNNILCGYYSKHFNQS